MKRIEMACYALMASAFVLAGILAVELNNVGGVAQTAHADMTLTRSNLTVMTARTKNDEEALFVLDNFTQRLLIFKTDLTKKRLELAIDPVSLPALFNQEQDKDSGKGSDRRRTGR